MSGTLSTVLTESGTILIVLPQNPKLDDVAAGLSLYLSLKDQKQADIYCPEAMRVEFNRLVGVNKIKTEAGNKNLVIKFANYKATDIERVSYDIENSEFKLTVVPKENAVAPNADQVVSSYAGVAADTAFLVGGTSLSDFPIAQDDLKDAKLVHFGTSAIDGAGASQIISLATPASSISETVYSLLKEAQTAVEADVATNLLYGIEDASAGFTSPATTASTFMAVSELMRAGGTRKSAVEAAQTMPQGAQVGAQPNPVEALSQVQNQPQVAPDQPQQPKQDWFGPKVYKGTTVS